MEIEPDLVVEDNAHLGKRKRSPEKKSHPIQDPFSLEVDTRLASPFGQDNPQVTPKRKRVEALAAHNDPNPWHNPGPGHVYSVNILSVPVEVLQHILSFLEPAMLCRLMGVNRYFHNLLDPRGTPANPSEKTRLPLLSANSIWSCSRKSHLPGVPHPLKSVTELDMLNLIYGRRCQFCGKLPASNPPRFKTTPWDSGPGPLGVRTIWPFKIRTCAECLRPLLVKETDLMRPGYSNLLNGLLSATFSPSLNYVMSISLNQTAPPPRLQLTRYYYQKDVHELSLQASKAHALGNGAYARWNRELDALRQEADTDVLRLEAWEIAQKPASNSLLLSSNVTSRSSASGSSAYSDGRSKSFATAPSGGYQALVAASNYGGPGSARSSSSLPRFDTGGRLLLSRTQLDRTINRAADKPWKVTTQIPIDQTDESVRPRTNQQSQDLIRLKSEKQFDIQQRCMGLVPPITPDILHHLPAFQSALRVLMPLNDASWEALKIELVSQSNLIESTDPVAGDSNSQPDVLDASSVWREATPAAGFVEIDLRKQASRPVREKLYDFAREYVHRCYADGTGLTYASAPQFAADVLLYVRQRFYENQEQEDAVFAACGEQPPDEGPSGLRARTLRLEHMRYVFETSVKPFTEFVRKELFLCSACDTQGRHFAFEAIIQHYASKHTDAFSRGAAVVYWKAIWPVEPPFQPEPSRDVDAAPSASGTISANGSTTEPSVRLAIPGFVQSFGEDHENNRMPRHAVRTLDFHQEGHGRYHLPYDNRRHQGKSAAPGSYQDMAPTLRHDPGSSDYPIQSEDTRRLDIPYPTASVAIHTSPRPFRDSPLSVYDPYPNVPVLQSQEQHYEDVPMTEAGETTLTDPRSGAGSRIISRSRPMVPDRPSSEIRYIGGPPTRYSFEPVTQREVHSTTMYSQPLNAAERFLDTFDDDNTPEYAKASPGPTPTHSQHALSAGNSEQRANTFDPRSNMSQPRRRLRMTPTSENEPTAEHFDTIDMMPRDAQDLAHEYAPTGRYEDGRSHSSYRDNSYIERYSYHTSPDERPRIYHVLDDAPGLYERRYPPQRTYYIDRHGREIQSLSPEVVYAEGLHYHDSRLDRRQHSNEPQIRYEYIPYGERIPVQNANYRPHYIGRPPRETQTGHRYEDDDQLPRRETMHDQEDARHFPNNSSRPPMNDPRYGRNPEER